MPAYKKLSKEQIVKTYKTIEEFYNKFLKKNWG